MDGITTLTLGVAAAALAGAICVTFAQASTDGALLVPLPGGALRQARPQAREQMTLQAINGMPASTVSRPATSPAANVVETTPVD
jgi:hypothetical protein